MGFLDQLYRDAVLQHARHPRNRGRLDPSTLSQEGVNPSCGDELEIHLLVEGGVVLRVAFTGEGCAISQASASMMTDVVRGLRVDEARERIASFKDMIHGHGADPSLGEAAALEGVSKLHARVKCATLAWVTLDEALDRLCVEQEPAAGDAQPVADAGARDGPASEGSSSDED
jgi:nitrogen fixation protein NifU and related proteins